MLGMIGLGVMGENLAVNALARGIPVVGHDLDPARRASFARRTAGQPALVAPTLEALVAALAPRRRVLLLVPAGPTVDALLAEIHPRLARGDVVIDGGNSWYADTERRLGELAGTGILYVGAGVSGGEEGARLGPAIMPGGDPAAWPLVRPILQALAARAPDGAPCCEWIGPGGAGHFVKMVHNGIEYADMQLIGEAYFLLARLLELTPGEARQAFLGWNQGELQSYLVEITADILGREDPETGAPLVSVILDTAEQKGTGRWTCQAALDLGAPAPTIAEAVFARALSGLKAERVEAAPRLAVPGPRWRGERERFQARLGEALLCAKVCAYAQGFALLRAAEAQLGWPLEPGRIAMLWRAGCIIRAGFLERIRAAYERDPKLANLLLDPYFAGRLLSCQAAWREVVAAAVQHGVPVPAFASALSYFDGYRSAALPANLLQAQRDFFGAHTYRRLDREGVFHTRWRPEG